MQKTKKIKDGKRREKQNVEKGSNSLKNRKLHYYYKVALFQIFSTFIGGNPLL